MKKILVYGGLLCVCAALSALVAPAQTGGQFALEQTVIASGGGQNAAGGAFALDGTIGQPLVGTSSANLAFNVAGGFWTDLVLTPTGAVVTVGGRVMTTDGRGIRNARVTLTNFSGASRKTLSGAGGYYNFTEVEPGETYIFTVFTKHYIFAQNTQIRSIVADADDINFVANYLFFR